MKPILIRTKDLDVSNRIVYKFKEIMEERGGVDSVASIDIACKLPDNGFDVLDKMVLMNDHLILKNISATHLFNNDLPFYYNYEFKDRLILCTVIDGYTRPIFPKGFHTINVDRLVGMVNFEMKMTLINNYANIAYLSAHKQHLNKRRNEYTLFELNHIERILYDKITKADKKIHSLLSKHKQEPEIYQSAI